jgi:hypothetical protein
MRYIEEAISGGTCQEIVEELSGDKRGAVRRKKSSCYERESDDRRGTVRKEEKSCYEREKASPGEELSGKRKGSSR